MVRPNTEAENLQAVKHLAESLVKFAAAMNVVVSIEQRAVYPKTFDQPTTFVHVRTAPPK